MQDPVPSDSNSEIDICSIPDGHAPPLRHSRLRTTTLASEEPSAAAQQDNAVADSRPGTPQPLEEAGRLQSAPPMEKADWMSAPAAAELARAADVATPRAGSCPAVPCGVDQGEPPVQLPNQAAAVLAREPDGAADTMSASVSGTEAALHVHMPAADMGPIRAMPSADQTPSLAVPMQNGGSGGSKAKSKFLKGIMRDISAHAANKEAQNCVPCTAGAAPAPALQQNGSVSAAEPQMGLETGSSLAVLEATVLSVPSHAQVLKAEKPILPELVAATAAQPSAPEEAPASAPSEEQQNTASLPDAAATAVEEPPPLPPMTPEGVLVQEIAFFHSVDHIFDDIVEW